MKVNALMQPFCPSDEPDAPRVTMTSAIRLVNRFCYVYLVNTVFENMFFCVLMDQKDPVSV